jgi:hypothetical protein
MFGYPEYLSLRYVKDSGWYHHQRFEYRLEGSRASDVGAVYEGVNELQNEKRKVPSSAEEGWMRGRKDIAKPPKSRADGWCWSTSIKIFYQHHPGASRHPLLC